MTTVRTLPTLAEHAFHFPRTPLRECSLCTTTRWRVPAWSSSLIRFNRAAAKGLKYSSVPAIRSWHRSGNDERSGSARCRQRKKYMMSCCSGRRRWTYRFTATPSRPSLTRMTRHSLTRSGGAMTRTRQSSHGVLASPSGMRRSIGKSGERSGAGSGSGTCEC